MSKLVFVIDDNDANLAVAASALENNYRVLTMPSAEKMFFLLEKKKFPEIIVLDIEMPGMDGMTALKKLKENPEWSGIPVLFLTGRDVGEVLSEACSLGAAGAVGKPIAPSELLRRVSEIIEK